MTFHSNCPLAPSARVARILAVMSAFFVPTFPFMVPFTLPVAVYFQRKARREIIESEGRYRSPYWLFDCPVLLTLFICIVLLFGFMLFLIVIAHTGLNMG